MRGTVRWRALPVLAALLGLAVPVGPARAAVSAPNDNQISVAVIATLSGSQAMAGLDASDGFTLGLKLLGQRLAGREVKTLVVDDKGSPDVARQAVQRLLDRTHAQFVVTVLSPGSLAAILPILDQTHQIVLNIGPAPASLAGAGCDPLVFDLGGNGDGVHEAAGQQLNTDQIHRLAVIGPDSPVTRDALTALKRTFRGEIVVVDRIRHGATTYRRDIARIAAQNPDALYDLLTGGVGVEFMRGWEVSGAKGRIPIYAPWTGFQYPTLQAMGGDALGVTTIGPWSADLDQPPTHRLTAEFELEYGRFATTWAALGFDAANLLDFALRVTHGHASDTAGLRQALVAADFPSVMGSWHFNVNQFAMPTFYVRKVARDAKGYLADETQGVVLKDWHDSYAGQCPSRWTTMPVLPALAAPDARTADPSLEKKPIIMTVPTPPPPLPPAAQPAGADEQGD
jgi:branched-chain amino acid transport system substrate-binding protein